MSMSEKNNKMPETLAIIGPYPPPLGGISVHIQRLEYYLKQQQIPYLIYNHYHFEKENVVAHNKSKWWYLKFLGNKKHKLVHFHQFIFLHFLYYFIFSRVNPAKMMLTIHNEKILGYGFWRKKMILWLLKHTKYRKLICVSKNLSGYLNQSGIDNIFLPAYVPAQPVEPKKLVLPTDKTPFLFSVWKIDKHTAEQVYNVPLILEFLKKYKAQFFMVFMIGNRKETDEVYLKRLLQDYNLENGKDLQILYDLPLTPYFKNFDFLVRTNTSDGYGVSLQEAMDAGIPAIASDVCMRPQGTVLFKSNELTDLEKKIFEVVKKPSVLPATDQPQSHLQLLDIYKKLLSLNETEVSKA